jgi:hypothetical protein
LRIAGEIVHKPSGQNEPLESERIALTLIDHEPRRHRPACSGSFDTFFFEHHGNRTEDLDDHHEAFDRRDSSSTYDGPTGQGIHVDYPAAAGVTFPLGRSAAGTSEKP